MKRFAPALVLCSALITAVPALAQQGSLVTISWGPTGVPGLKYHVSCSALSGTPSWDYMFENVTDKPIRFSYAFGARNLSHMLHVHWYTVPPHGHWTLHHVAANYACSSNGPLQVEPETTP